tara:strand:- start:3728 stop:4000 length:273 start_codon:yes stop_codon:yes gene_type:complete
MSIDWEEAVKEYKKQYDDEDGIHEYVESLLPVYYGDIYQTYHDIIGTPLSIKILNAHVGMTIDKILLWDIYTEYSNAFHAEYKLSNDEEE